jgi:hypothetical protein
VPGLVRCLDGEQLLHLPEVRVHPGQQSGRDHQRGLLVLDEVGHHLDHGRLDLGGHVGGGAGGPVDRGRRIPLRRRGVRVEPGREVGPDDVAVGDVEPGGCRAAGLDQCAAGCQPPVGRGAAHDAVRARTAGSFRAGPSLVVRRPRLDLAPVGLGGEAVPPATTPRAQVNGERGITPDDAQQPARRQSAQGAFHEDVGALFEAEPVQVEPGSGHGT